MGAGWGKDGRDNNILFETGIETASWQAPGRRSTSCVPQGPWDWKSLGSEIAAEGTPINPVNLAIGGGRQIQGRNRGADISLTEELPRRQEDRAVTRRLTECVPTQMHTNIANPCVYSRPCGDALALPCDEVILNCVPRFWLPTGFLANMVWQ